ncbi:hypothetical protein GCM10016455_08930 [Aliiroseovarius zhejiangensis]|uniref:HdeD family acid-resistance protein n=1 Tax=Aliiroseovarius zhejiangensis TaxID=1632025 RepID=A0ABQ3ISY2_9RHOB|nr:DUF308 domain-containing protein [Aliiroseovarius zhejiangensis]GHE90736.1 hypothetical protein GCM10016455_08930 [Aliiroseovarius zhejiangensis]
MRHWIFWMIAGIISLVGGVLALANPLAASLTAEILVGWSFVLIGLIVAISAFRDQGWGARLSLLLLGVLFLLLGISLLANPLQGMLALTYTIAIMLMMAGLFRLILAFRAEFRPFRWIMIASAALSIILALMIFSNFPQSAAVVLGVYLAIELISNGVSLIVIALARKSIVKELG